MCFKKWQYVVMNNEYLKGIHSDSDSIAGGRQLALLSIHCTVKEGGSEEPRFLHFNGICVCDITPMPSATDFQWP